MYDVVVVGGGIAGLSAGLILARARRSVLVLNGGAPRNTPAQHAHGFISRDGIPPLELLQLAREDLAAYPNIKVADSEAESAHATPEGFNVLLTNGEKIETRKLLLATGVIDDLPEIPGLAELWGNGVYHCPYCHGWEIRDRPWAILGVGPQVSERAALFRTWASDLSVLTNGATGLAPSEKQRLNGLDVAIIEGGIARLDRTNDDAVKVIFEDGSSHSFGGVFILPHQKQRSPLAEALGCAVDEFLPTDSRYIRADAVSGETTVSGVYAVGDMTGPTQSLILAAAAGARAAYRLNHSLAIEDAETLVGRMSRAT